MSWKFKFKSVLFQNFSFIVKEINKLFRLLNSFSKNDELRAILREVTIEGKSKQFIEIWDQYHLIKSYDLSALDVHGEVYSGG